MELDSVHDLVTSVFAEKDDEVWVLYRSRCSMMTWSKEEDSRAGGVLKLLDDSVGVCEVYLDARGLVLRAAEQSV